MNQPKFKFGDKVRVIRCPLFNGQVFDVETVTYLPCMFNYVRHSDNQPFWENQLELYTEPKTKKLYAYLVSISIKGNHFAEVKFASNMDLEEAGSWKRAPEFDIEWEA